MFYEYFITMTEDQRFSNREIQLMFKNIELLLKDIKEDIANTNTSFDIRFKDLEKEVDGVKGDVKELQSFQTKAMVLWSVGVVVIGWVLNNLTKIL